MKTNYLSFSKASRLAADHQQLTGRPLQDGCIIDFVVVAPYSRIIQWSFVTELLRGAEPDAQRYATNDRYNAIIVSRCTNAPAGFLIKDLRAYLKEATNSTTTPASTTNNDGK